MHRDFVEKIWIERERKREREKEDSRRWPAEKVLSYHLTDPKTMEYIMQVCARIKQKKEKDKKTE